jgi:Rab-like protein 3
VRSLAAGSSSSVKLSRFFDKVIERRYHCRDGVSPFSDKRRMLASLNVKFYHSD